MQALPITILNSASSDEVINSMKDRKPILIKGWDIGSCVGKWNFEYVSSKTGSEPVRVHVSANGKLDFINKNFVYKTLPLSELIQRVSRTHQTDFFIQSTELYYLRSIGSDPRGKTVANFKEQFPKLAEDVKFPPFFDEKDIFSTVFRASSQGVQLWTHYDVMDNVLIQITGVKKVILWPPSEIDNMYMVGDKSRVIDVDNPNPLVYPKFIKAERYETIMNAGDILYIPALWFHNTLTIEPSLGVNAFWKNLPHELYDKNDSYGNKDLLPFTRGMQAIESLIKVLNDLPPEYKNFYIRRMVNQLEGNLRGRSQV